MLQRLFDCILVSAFSFVCDVGRIRALLTTIIITRAESNLS